MWDPSATPQDPDMLVHALEGPVAQNFRPADVVFVIVQVRDDVVTRSSSGKAASTDVEENVEDCLNTCQCCSPINPSTTASILLNYIPAPFSNF